MFYYIFKIFYHLKKLQNSYFMWYINWIYHFMWCNGRIHYFIQCIIWIYHLRYIKTLLYMMYQSETSFFMMYRSETSLYTVNRYVLDVSNRWVVYLKSRLHISRRWGMYHKLRHIDQDVLRYIQIPPNLRYIYNLKKNRDRR